MDLSFSVPCLFGLEGLAADELRRLKFSDVRADNGRVLFSGSSADIPRANINLRTGERVLLVVGDAPVLSFDQLYESVLAMPWERFIPSDGAFPVKGHALASKLHSVPDCQKIIKKAVASRLMRHYNVNWLKESAAKYQIQFAIMNDFATLYLDTSGAGLHKRGYRPVGNAAPLRETLAAAIVKLSRFRGRELVCDPFCGSGTIPIEAAFAALNRAPGLNRSFAAQNWSWLDPKLWDSARDEAKDHEFNGNYDICGSDINPNNIQIAQQNAIRAGVQDLIRFDIADARGFNPGSANGIVLTNPPYGERVMDRSEAELIYKAFGDAVKNLDGWKLYILSSHTEFERTFGKSAVKKRKLYNGMIKCDLFMYF